MLYSKEGRVVQENVVAVDSTVNDWDDSMAVCVCSFKRIREQCVLQWRHV